MHYNELERKHNSKMTNTSFLSEAYRLNTILIIGSEIYSRYYMSLYDDWTVDIIFRANCLCSKTRNYLWRHFLSDYNKK